MTIDSKLSVISWNLNSLDAKRLPVTRKDSISLESWFDLTEPSIAAFQETYWSSSHDKLKLSHEYQHIPAVSNIHGSRSLSIFLHPTIVRVKDGVIGDENLFCQWVESRVPDIGSLVVVNVYLPSMNSLGGSNAPIKKLYAALSTQVNVWKNDGKRVLIVGDFNTHNPLLGGSMRSNGGNKARVKFENIFIDECTLFHPVLPFPTRRRNSLHHP